MIEFLTEKQQTVKDAIRDYYLEHGCPPSLSELQEVLGIGTKHGVVKHLEALERKGYIFRSGGPRGIQLAEEEFNYLLGIPILGYANAGKPMMLAQESDLGKLQIDRSLLPKSKELFALIVQGDSMNKKKLNSVPIENGNYVVVSKGEDVINGDVVLAVIDGCATIKSYKKQGDYVVLYPDSSNPVHRPIYLDANTDSMINGKVIMSLSNPSFKR